MKRIDLSSKRFGRLVVLYAHDRIIYPSRGQSTRYMCACDCGGSVLVHAASLRKGSALSCGCLKAEKNKARSLPAEERFPTHYTVSAGGCWLWNTAPSKRRYPSFFMNGERHQAHHAAWLLFKGPIPEGMQVLHRCDVPHCVNPEHLFLGTHADNMADMKAKGRARNRHTKEVAPCA